MDTKFGVLGRGPRMNGSDHWDVVPISDLHRRMNFATPLDSTALSTKIDLAAWRMELDDAPILRYLLRQHAPRRHLEFGTWQGAGTLLCLEETEATVWTINALDPERRDSGEIAYGMLPSDRDAVGEWARTRGLTAPGKTATDSFGYIGWRYLDRGQGHRVCQIYSDSLKWDTRAYPLDFFDSVLIDGGHAPDVVVSDTRKALALTRSGGMIVWHDFCPPVRDSMSVVDGVMTGIERMSSWLSAQLVDWFWIEPSWILVGVKR